MTTLFISTGTILSFLISYSTYIDKKDVEYYTIPTKDQMVFDICYSPNGTSLIVADGSLIKCFSTDDYSLQSTSVEGHNDRILTIDISRDSALLASGGKDSTIILWDTERNSILKRLSYHKGIITSLKISPDKNYLISGATDNKVIIYDLIKQKIKQVISDHNDDVTSVSFSPNQNQNIACSAGGDGSIFVYDFKKETLIQSLDGYKNWVREISFSNDGTRLISCGDNSKLVIWSVDDFGEFRNINTLDLNKSWLFTAKFNEDKRVFATGGVKGVANISVLFGDYKAKVKAPINDIEFKPNNGVSITLALATQGKGVLIINAEDMQLN